MSTTLGRTAVVPEGYTLPTVTHDRIGTLLFAHPENVPAEPPLNQANLTKEVALRETFIVSRKEGRINP